MERKITKTEQLSPKDIQIQALYSKIWHEENARVEANKKANFNWLNRRVRRLKRVSKRHAWNASSNRNQKVSTFDWERFDVDLPGEPASDLFLDS